jgi:hypothetical protein
VAVGSSIVQVYERYERYKHAKTVAEACLSHRVVPWMLRMLQKESQPCKKTDDLS